MPRLLCQRALSLFFAFRAMKIFHTVNAGLYICNDEQGLLIDGLHLGSGGFSETPVALLDRLLSHAYPFSGKTDLVFTHLHGDHYDLDLVRRFLQRNPHSSIYLPQPGDAKTAQRVHFDRFVLTAFSTVHDGAAFAQVPHRSFCLQAENRQIVICGDGIVHRLLAEQIQALCGDKTDAVFVNVYQLASKEGQEFLNALNPEHIFLYHLPFPEEDPYGYRSMAKNVVARQPENLRQRIRIPEPMSEITIS